MLYLMRGFFKVYRNKVLKPSNGCSTGTWKRLYRNIQVQNNNSGFICNTYHTVHFQMFFEKYNEILICMVLLGFF